MKSFCIVFLVALIFCSCTKNEDETITAFKGVALTSSNNEPVSAGYIAIDGYEDTSFFGSDRQTFSSATTTKTDGTFSFQTTTSGNVDYLVIQVKIPGTFSTTTCGTIFCSDLKPGKDYLDMILYVTSTAF